MEHRVEQFEKRGTFRQRLEVQVEERSRGSAWRRRSVLFHVHSENHRVADQFATIAHRFGKIDRQGAQDLGEIDGAQRIHETAFQVGLDIERDQQRDRQVEEQSREKAL